MLKLFLIPSLLVLLVRACPYPETEPGYYWRSWNGTVPYDAVIAGSDSRGIFYIAKAWLPGKGIYVGQVFPNQTTVDVCWSAEFNSEDKVESSDTIEVLCSSGLQPTWHGSTIFITQHIRQETKYEVVVGGITSEYDDMYPILIARLATAEGVTYIGNVHTNNFMFYVNEKGFSDDTGIYELLVIKNETDVNVSSNVH